MKNHNKCLILLAAATLPTMVHANVIFPSFVAMEGVFQVFGYSIIMISLVIEFILLYAFIDRRWMRVTGVTVLMNACSALVGIIGLIFADLIYKSVFLNYFKNYITQFTAFGGASNLYNNIFYAIFLYCAIVIINTIIETSIARIFFRNVSAKRLIGIIALANAITGAIGFLGLMWYVYVHGQFPPIKF